MGRVFAPAHGALQTRDRSGHRLLYGPGSALQHDAQKRHVAVRPGHTNKICMSYFWRGPMLAVGTAGIICDGTPACYALSDARSCKKPSKQPKRGQSCLNCPRSVDCDPQWWNLISP